MAPPAPAEPAPAEPAPTQEQAPVAETPQAETPAPSAETVSGGSGASGTEVTLPELGESVTEGTVSRWLKQVGDAVATDEPLLEISTDKVDTEIPSPAAGTLLEIRAKEDETVQVGAVLAVIGDSESVAAPAPQAAAPAPRNRAIGRDLPDRGARIAAWMSRRPEGTRNASLFWAACRLVEQEIPETDARRLLVDAALRAGLAEAEATSTVRSAYRVAVPLESASASMVTGGVAR